MGGCLVACMCACVCVCIKPETQLIKVGLSSLTARKSRHITHTHTHTDKTHSSMMSHRSQCRSHRRSGAQQSSPMGVLLAAVVTLAELVLKISKYSFGRKIRDYIQRNSDVGAASFVEVHCLCTILVDIYVTIWQTYAKSHK